MTTIDESILKNTVLFNAKLTSSNHFMADCPFCNKEGHFYINRKTQLWDCKKCGENGNLFRLLLRVNKLNLLAGKIVQVHDKLPNKIFEQNTVEQIDLFTPTIKFPVGFKRIDFCSYLQKRGFTDEDYNSYHVGKTKLVLNYTNYVLMGVFSELELKGFIARCVLSKNQLQKLEQQKSFKIPRYQNSKQTKFNKLLLGVDEVSFLTDTVILVEGLFDKKRVDDFLGLRFDPSLKCCATFGKNISLEQVLILLSKGISKVILIQDPDAVKDSKQNAFWLQKYFETVLVGFCPETDLGDSSDHQLETVFKHLSTPENFFTHFVEKKFLS